MEASNVCGKVHLQFSLSRSNISRAAVRVLWSVIDISTFEIAKWNWNVSMCWALRFSFSHPLIFHTSLRYHHHLLAVNVCAWNGKLVLLSSSYCQLLTCFVPCLIIEQEFYQIMATMWVERVIVECEEWTRIHEFMVKNSTILDVVPMAKPSIK